MRFRKLLTFTTIAALTGGVGYWKREQLRPYFAKLQPTQPKSCTYGDPVSCHADELCAYVTPEQTQCIKRYVGPTPFVRFPFNPEDSVVCAQGPASAAGKGHSYVNTLYSIDLASPKKDELGAIVYASMDGTAFVHRGCRSEPEDKNDPCGAGYGNHVRIMNSSGYMLLYAHLDAVFVDDGQVIKRGTEIGREGSSGMAGHRHLHFSVHFSPVESFIEAVSFYRGQVGATPPSIPFETQFCDPEDRKDCRRRRVRMDQIPCDGKTLLRADWRD